MAKQGIHITKGEILEILSKYDLKVPNEISFDEFKQILNDLS